jgi:hypothetical protein
MGVSAPWLSASVIGNPLGSTGATGKNFIVSPLECLVLPEWATQINEEIEPELARLLVRPKLSRGVLSGMDSAPTMLPETHSFVRLHRLPNAPASKVSLRFSFQGAREAGRLD